MLASFITSNIVVQTVIFLIVSVALLFATKPLVNKFLNSKTIQTNVFSIIGKKAIVISDIKPIESKGQIKINGEVWSAESINGQNIPEGSEVEIISINGVKAIVSAIKIA